VKNNKKIDVLFGVAVIAFLAVTIVLIKEFNARRTSDYKEYTATVSNIVRLKNNKIKILANELAAKSKENEDLKKTLAEARNALDALSKKLAPPAPAVQAAAAVPAAAVKAAPAAK
jgi:septal ring factor EnvC (AmiA/AmiB activator)